MERALRYVLFYSALLAAWAIVAKLKIWPPYLFPTPWGVGEAHVGWFHGPQFLDRHWGQHETHAPWLRLVCGSRNDPGSGRGQ